MNIVATLHRIYRAERARPFAWGDADCLGFAASCAMALGRPDPITHLRGRYVSEIGAKRVMIAQDWQNLGDVAASIYPSIEVAQAQSGDWAWVINPDGSETIGVVIKDMIWARTPTGLGAVPLTVAQQAYRVGRC